MKKLLCLTIALMLVLSSMSALADGVAPATGTSPIKATAEATLRTIEVKFQETPFDASDDVTFLFYKPESDTSDNIIEENIVHADQIDYDANGFSFTVGTDVEAGKYILLIGGTDVDVPCLIRVELKESVTYGDVTLDTKIMSDDAIKVLKFSFNYPAEKAEFEANPVLKIAADVTHDGFVRSDDAIKVLKKAFGYPGIDLEAAGN